MVTDGNHTYGEHWVMYRTVKSICYTPETKVTLYANDTSIISNNVLKSKWKNYNERPFHIHLDGYNKKKFTGN